MNIKVGLDYFPLDVRMDDKIGLIEAEFGLIGFAVVVKLYQKIYGQQGYYCEWTPEVALLFSKEIGTGHNVVSEIVKSAVRRGIFDPSMYEKYHILTSRGIQKRYIEASGRRKVVNIEKRYLLIDAAQIYQNVHILSQNVDNFKENADGLKQSKVKESKGKESKYNSRGSCGFARFWEEYPRKVGKADAEKAWAKLNPSEETEEAILDGVRRWKKTRQWTKDNGAFIPYPATFLRGQRWKEADRPAYEEKDYDEGKDFFGDE